VDALGRPVDGRGPIAAADRFPIERMAPGVIDRKNVSRPVQTGVRSVDAMFPIGRGQRELIIGDRQTGKTAIALDTIMNQADKDLVCVYVAIGQKRAQVARVVATLEEHGAMDHTIVVVASASDPAALQYIAPYAGCAMASTSWSRARTRWWSTTTSPSTPGPTARCRCCCAVRRGAKPTPGDVFYLHSRLLERAAQLSDAQGGGA